VLFWHVCGKLFLVGGWGFLTGFLPAIPLCMLGAKRLADGKYDIGTFAWIITGFTAYFWSSAAILVWKAGTESHLNIF
jgi:hypothetical protein